MQYLNYTITRVKSFLQETERLLSSDFPYPYSKDALHAIRKVFEINLDFLNRLGPSSDPKVVSQNCERTIQALFQYLPSLGFLLRSTNVRNAFEIYGPLRRLAINLLEPGIPEIDQRTRLILSSEWGYSPFIQNPKFPSSKREEGLLTFDFFFIGFPATEAGNPLLIPLAGHELGHALWTGRKLKPSFTPKIKQGVTERMRKNADRFRQTFGFEVDELETDDSLIIFEPWQEAIQSALSQAKETYCDCIGLRIFGPAFMHAFSYLLSPNGAGIRTSSYPSIRCRVNNLLQAAKEFAIPVPEDYGEMFTNDGEPLGTEKDRFVVDIADETLQSVVPQLIERAEDSIDSSVVQCWSYDGTKDVLASYRIVVPAEGCKSIADILNAAWMAFRDDNFWNDVPEIQGRNYDVLKELVLKNFEIMEFEHVVRESS